MVIAAAFGAAHAEKLTLDEAIRVAQAYSPEAQAAAHTYRAAYWSYRSFRANYLPEVNLVSSPYLNRQINRVTQPDGTEQFLRQNQLIADLGIQVSQNVWFTGGNLFVQTSSQRMDELENHIASYNTNPVTIGYQQSLFGYNSLKWDRRIEPVRFREAKKSYAETLELIASKTCELFFELATAQANLDIAQSNYASADTLYRYARGRYNIGSITENEMLQLEVNKLNEETNMMKARIEVEDAMLTFRSFLGIREETEVEVLTEGKVPHFEVPLGRALEEAYLHSPEPDMYRRLKLESKSQLAQARANRGLKADLYLQFGLSQTSDKLKESWRDPLDQQYVSLSLVIPILDWGRGRGRVRVAKSNVDLVNTQAEQGMNDFELNVRKMVRQFNLQARQVEVAARTDETARDHPRPECRYLRERYGKAEPHRGDEDVLDALLRPSQPDAIRFRAQLPACGEFAGNLRMRNEEIRMKNMLCRPTLVLKIFCKCCRRPRTMLKIFRKCCRSLGQRLKFSVSAVGGLGRCLKFSASPVRGFRKAGKELFIINC